MAEKNFSTKTIANCSKKFFSEVITAGILVLGVILLFAAGGCGFGGPKVRLGSLPTSTFGVPFADPNNLGTHSYSFNPFEKGGIVYTCKAGHIDIDHVRGSADLTRYFTKKTRETLLKNQKGFSYSLAMEFSSHKIDFIYPENWKNMPGSEKQKAADEIAFELGPYIAYNSTVWHEILTWFGVRFAGIEPEFNSAFSWEDLYSNLVGTRLAAEALKDTRYNYNDAMTKAIDKELRELGVQPKRVAVAASEKMRGKWFIGDLVPDTKMRNFDIGLDGFITPTLVPGVSECNDKPLSYPVPNLDILKKYGITMVYEIKPNVFEQNKIFKAAGEKRIYPEKHFPAIMEFIKKEAVKMGYEFDS
jgi:hypothetical protein